jgi:hypothetical protein
MSKFIFLLLLCLAQIICEAQEYSAKNLQSNWLKYTNGNFEPFSQKENLKTVHLSIAQKDFLHETLAIVSPNDFNIFINNTIASSVPRRTLLLSIDSLGKKYGDQFLITIHSRNQLDHKNISISVAVPSTHHKLKELFYRTNDGFQDFCISCCIILVLILGALFRSNPRLMLDYLNFMKIVSLREREENLLSNRVTSSSNILYYLTSSLLTGFLLLIIIQKGLSVTFLTSFFKFTSLGEAYAKWLLLSLIIAASLFCKLFIIYVFSSWFNLRKSIQLHFFNLIRTVLLIQLLFGIIFLGVYTFHMPILNYAQALLVISIISISTWIFSTYLKLLTNTHFHFFHLFSYLCATEIIPFIFLIKIIS